MLPLSAGSLLPSIELEPIPAVLEISLSALAGTRGSRKGVDKQQTTGQIQPNSLEQATPPHLHSILAAFRRPAELSSSDRGQEHWSFPEQASRLGLSLSLSVDPPDILSVLLCSCWSVDGPTCFTPYIHIPMYRKSYFILGLFPTHLFFLDNAKAPLVCEVSCSIQASVLLLCLCQHQ